MVQRLRYELRKLWMQVVCLTNKRSHDSRDFPNHGNCDRVTELLVCACIGDWNPELVRVPHKTRALAWSKPAWVLLRPLANQDFGSVLIVSRRKRPRDINSATDAGGLW